MDPRCAAIHPMHPPLPLHPPSPVPCVQCAMSTVTNSKAIYTLRRSACNTFTSLADDLPNLLRLGVSFLSDVLHDLLNTLFTLSPSQSELAKEVGSICVRIACHYDKCTDGLPGKTLSELLFSECTAAIMLQHKTLNTSMSIILLARLCEVGESQEIELPFESLPDDFAYHILVRCAGSTFSYSALNVLLKYVLKGIEPRASKELLQAASSILPTPRDPDADRMFLTVTYYLSEADPKALLECDTLPVVLKTAFMSSVKDLRETASDIIVKISDEPRLALKLHNTAVFEYIVESLRISDVSNVQVPLLCYSATALAALARKQTSETWIFSLDVVLSVARHLGAHIQELEPVLCFALGEAPAPLFSTPLVEAVVSFTMQMLAHKKDVTQLIQGISSLLERHRPDVSSLHAILTVVEAIVNSKDQMCCVSSLATNVGRHFIRLSKQIENASDALVRLGRRLSFATFETWISTHKETVEAMKTSRATAPAFCSCDTIACVIDMFTTMLHKSFTTVGAYDFEDRRKVVLWCWQMLPPRVAFACCVEAEGENHILNSVASYIRTISSEYPFEEPVVETSVPVTEELFLAALSAASDESNWLTASQLLRRALELELLENLCQPELVLRALGERLNVCFSRSLTQYGAEAAIVVRLLSQVCAHYGLIFPKPEIPEAILVSTLTNSEFSFSCRTDCLTFLSIIGEGSPSVADVVAWEILADFFRVALCPQTALSDVMKRILEDDSSLQSALYSISEARDPIAIAECLLYIMRARARPNQTFGRSLEEAGVLSTACQSLRNVESTFNRGEEVRHPSQGGKHPNGYHRNMKIGISFLILLTGAAFISNSRAWRTLTRAVCDVFVLGAADKCKTALNDALLTAALNYLVALTPTATSGRLSSLGYIWQSGVVDYALRMLKTLSQEDRIRDRLASASCSFLVMILNIEDKTFLTVRRKTILSCLREDVCWDRMLSSFPVAADIDAAIRIASCCLLVKDLLSADSDSNLKPSKVTSHKTLVALTVAASSVFDIVRNAAFDVLESLMQKGTTTFDWQTCLTVHCELSWDLTQKAHDTSIENISLSEISYLQQAIQKGHVDKYLTKQSSTLSSKGSSTYCRRNSDRGQSNNEYHDKVIQSLEQRKIILSSQGTELSAENRQAQPRHATH